MQTEKYQVSEKHHTQKNTPHTTQPVSWTWGPWPTFPSDTTMITVHKQIYTEKWDIVSLGGGGGPAQGRGGGFF